METNEIAEVKSKITELKAQRKLGTQENHDRVVAYRACAQSNKALSAQIHELEANIRTTKSTVTLESLTIDQVESILAKLKSQNAE
jgi:flagellar biosynthesis chaperone FliJ